MRLSALFLFVFLLGCAGSGPLSADEPQSLPISPLEIKTATGTYRFDVEVALSPQQKRIGLMYRREMADDHGMLFYYTFPQKVGMWMKNTYIPLDMLFIFSDGTVAGIVTDTEPFSLKDIVSQDYVNAVLELNAGTVARLGIEEGDTVRHQIFGNLYGEPREQ